MRGQGLILRQMCSMPRFTGQIIQAVASGWLLEGGKKKVFEEFFIVPFKGTVKGETFDKK